ncbi:hypothetical protein Q0N71_20725 [Bacillus thuringiensis]|uniref:hypothetical protein n=1 Tax=Bacillus thuringiensis TaxID=1428 RepID=UPI00345763BC
MYVQNRCSTLYFHSALNTLGLSFTSETPKTQLGYVALNIGDTPAPQRPNLVQSVDVSKDYNSTTTEKAL